MKPEQSEKFVRKEPPAMNINFHVLENNPIKEMKSPRSKASPNAKSSKAKRAKYDNPGSIGSALAGNKDPETMNRSIQSINNLLRDRKQSMSRQSN